MALLGYAAWHTIAGYIANQAMVDEIRDLVGRALVQPRIQLAPSLLELIQKTDPNFKEEDLQLTVRGDEYATVEFQYHRYVDYHYWQLPIPFHIDMQVTRPKRSEQMQGIVNSFESSGQSVESRMKNQIKDMGQ